MDTINHKVVEKLSKRERQVFDLILQGLLVKDICKELNLKSNTVSTFKKKIFDKTGTSNIIELFRFAHAIK